MLVFDGDSVLVPGEFGVPADKCWPSLVSKNASHHNFAQSESTAGKCRTRLWKTLELNPKWYILQVGQWSQNHEPISDFERHIRAIIEELHWHDIRVCLVSPPLPIQKRFNVIAYVHLLESLSKIYRTDFVNLYAHLQSVDKPDTWFINDNAQCHFNEIGFARMAQLFESTVKW